MSDEIMNPGMQSWCYVREFARQDPDDRRGLAPLSLYLLELELTFTCFQRDAGEALLVAADRLIEAVARSSGVVPSDLGDASGTEKILFFGGDVSDEHLEELVLTLTRGPLGWELLRWIALDEEFAKPAATFATRLSRTEIPSRIEFELPLGTRTFDLFRVCLEAMPEMARSRARPIIGEGDTYLSDRQDWWQRRQGSGIG